MLVHVSWREAQSATAREKGSWLAARQRVVDMSHIEKPGDRMGVYSGAFSTMSAGLSGVGKVG